MTPFRPPPPVVFCSLHLFFHLFPSLLSSPCHNHNHTRGVDGSSAKKYWVSSLSTAVFPDGHPTVTRRLTDSRRCFLRVISVRI